MDSSLAIGRDPMIHDLKESLIGDFEGKKRQRVGDFFEGVFESLDSVRKVFFMKTKLDSKRMELIRMKGGVVHGIEVAAEGPYLSYTWKSICAAKELYTKHIQLGRERVSIRLVSELINQDVRRWDDEKLTLHLDEVTTERVHCIPHANHFHKDMIVWGEESPVDELQRRLPAKRVGSERWRPLEFPFHKLNFDVVFNGCGKRSCTGIVVRNWEGRVVVSNIVINDNIPTNFATETIACF
ncbi:hypothetical protein PVK06_034626 [Gossypium arboreum]|uniref:Uncharacterized protein n=1 Tax=Gossypium arboreum TaxID=29729 RepID=A0ABR0NES7_GOSAR|nr:hypothetical protein PVK06_034626 [Gossypium arboreum]